MNKPMISDNRNNMCAKGKKAILVVSYGTSHSDGRLKAINAIEDAIANANDDYEIKRAFSGKLIIDNIRNKTGEEISDVEQAVARLVENGVKTLII
ncbi:MAG: sirohydrochlorin cobaltochelatase, partial [Oscillospiraceae bacterium]|nr:sirohydrochlorin cobaltochelatase [Oscillospiraceae bacterium]